MKKMRNALLFLVSMFCAANAHNPIDEIRIDDIRAFLKPFGITEISTVNDIRKAVFDAQDAITYMSALDETRKRDLCKALKKAFEIFKQEFEMFKQEKEEREKREKLEKLAQAFNKWKLFAQEESWEKVEAIEECD